MMGKRRTVGKMIAVGTSLGAMTTLAGTAPAYAGTVTTGTTYTFSFINNSNQSVTCSFRLKAENTPYQNQQKIGYGEFDNVSTDSRCVVDLGGNVNGSPTNGYFTASWITPTGGGGGASALFAGVGPGQTRSEIFAPLHSTANQFDNQFYVGARFTFRNCAQNCTYDMPSLHAKL
jgi:hypothetical protein